MQTPTTGTLPAGRLKRFNIRICTGRETAIQTALARSNAQAWNIAFSLAESLLGDVPPRSISVKPVGVGSGLYLPAGQALQANAVGRPVGRALGGNAPIVEEVDAPLGIHLPVKADRLNLLVRQGLGKDHTPFVAHQGLVAAI